MNYKLIFKILLSYIKTILVILLISFTYISVINWKDIAANSYSSMIHQEIKDYDFLGNWQIIGNIIAYSIFIIIAIFSYKLYIKGTKNLAFKLKKLKFKWKDFLIISISFIFTVFIENFLGKVTNYHDDNLSGSMDVWKFIEITWVLAVIIAPIMEEILFRGFLFNFCLNKKIVTKENEKLVSILTIILSIILFTLAHSFKFDASFIAHLPMSILFACIYYKYKNLKITILLHFLNNLYASTFLTVMIWDQISKALFS